MELNKQQRRSGLLISGLCLTLTGCGELSYKRGAGPTDFQQEKRTCSSDYKTDNEIEKCLEKNGWIVVGTDKPLIKNKAAVPAEKATLKDEKVIETPILDPFDKIAIGSWWKMGASPSTLMADSESCVKRLGDAHQTENNMSLVTRGLLICMGDKGWHAQ